MALAPATDRCYMARVVAGADSSYSMLEARRRVEVTIRDGGDVHCKMMELFGEIVRSCPFKTLSTRGNKTHSQPLILTVEFTSYGYFLLFTPGLTWKLVWCLQLVNIRL